MEQVYPGDLIDLGGGFHHVYPQWWHDIKDQMENIHQLRKCDFLERIPDTGDRCPGVATHTDKYYCIFGTELKPSWYCTCFERIGEFKFHCNSYDLIEEDTIIIDETSIDNDDEERGGVDEAIQDAILYSTINESNTITDESVIAESIQDAIVNGKSNDNSNTMLGNNKEDDEEIHPGDYIDEDHGYRHVEPQWWHNIKDTMTENSHLLRKCDFLDRIPNTNDNCPGVATHDDHYYCIFGTTQKPLWYCTCYEHVGDYKFHCNADSLLSVDDILQYSKEEAAANVATFAIDHVDNAIQHSVAFEREEEDGDPPIVALIPPDKVSLISTTSEGGGGESPTMDDKAPSLRNNNNGYPANIYHHHKWSTGFSFGVGFSIGILSAAMMIVVYLRILHRRRRHRFINEEVCDPTLGTTTYQTPPPPPPPPRVVTSMSSPPLRLPIPPTGVIMQNLLWDQEEEDREQQEQRRQLVGNSFLVV